MMWRKSFCDRMKRNIKKLRFLFFALATPLATEKYIQQTVLFYFSFLPVPPLDCIFLSIE